MKYYLDTSVFIDYYLNRSDKFRPLGEWAFKLLSLIKANSEVLLISEFILKELHNQFSITETEELLKPFKEIIQLIICDEFQLKEATLLCRKLNIPFGDALHAILARDNQAILITRDHHFESLRNIVEVKKPEELI